MVRLESLLLSLMLDIKENRDVATVDVLGAFLLADINEHILIKITGDAVKIMCDANKECRKYVTHEKGKPVLYMKLLKSLYGCMQSALLWYRAPSTKLTKMGFKLNPYDPCVTNLNINEHQCTVCW